MKRICSFEIDADVIDKPFSKRFLERLGETHDFDEYQCFITDVLQKRDEEVSSLSTQLKVLEDQQQGILTDIIDIRAKIIEQARSDGEKKQLEKQAAPLIGGLHARYIELEGLKQELTALLPKSEETAQFQNIKRFADFQTEVRKLIPFWGKKPFAVRFEFVTCL